MSICRKEPHEEGAGARSHRDRVQVLMAQRQTEEAEQVSLCKSALIVRLGAPGEGLQGGVPGGEDHELKLYIY